MRSEGSADEVGDTPGSPGASAHEALMQFLYLAPIGLVASAPLVIVVNAASPWKTLPELLAAARAKPGSVAYATFGPGSGPQLAGALLGLEAGVKFLEVPYKGSAPAMSTTASKNGRCPADDRPRTVGSWARCDTDVRRCCASG